MAEIAKAGLPSLSSLNPSPDQFPKGTAGENVAAGDNLYLAADGTYYRCLGATGAVTDRCRGQAAAMAFAGEPVTITRGLRFWYGSGLTAGADVFLSATAAGGIATTAPYAGAKPVGYVLEDGARVQFFYAF